MLEHLQDELYFCIPKSPSGTGMSVIFKLLSVESDLRQSINSLLFPNAAGFLHSYDHFVMPAKFYVMQKFMRVPWWEGI